MRDHISTLRLFLQGIAGRRPAPTEGEYQWPCGCVAKGDDLESSDIEYCGKHAAGLGRVYSKN